MKPLADPILSHLLRVTAEPDLSSTPYRLAGHIGQGGMGSIWEVEDSRLDRRVALKVLHNGTAIREEAKTAATLEHPGIAPVYETGLLEDGRSYYTMRLIRGKTLAEAITPELPLRERLRLWLSVAETLDFAHSRGVHHRDLKPDNILVGDYGEVVVLDWGIAERNSTNHGDDLAALARLLSYCLPPKAAKPLRAIAEANYDSVRQAIKDVHRFQDGAPVSTYRESILEKLWRWSQNNQALLLLLFAYAAAKLFLVFLRWT
jgi:serine/threonine protein kinase